MPGLPTNISTSSSPSSMPDETGGASVDVAEIMRQPSTAAQSDLSRVPGSLQPAGTAAEQNKSRGRALSRSSSLPIIMRHSTREDRKSLSPTRTEAEVINISGTRHSNSSVKHLTCFWWKEKGICRFSDEDCLYAHHDTGHYTDPPRQLVPGEPALAGRKLDRAMRHLAITVNRSTASLSSIAGSRYPSRPSTPVIGGDVGAASTISFTSPLSSPLAVQHQFHYGTDYDLGRLNSDNQFLRTLVDQNSKEKAILISTIESLQTENRGMEGEVEGLRTAQEQLLVERDGLRKRIKQLEDAQQARDIGSAHISNNPFGAIGRRRVNTEARYLGGLLTED